MQFLKSMSDTETVFIERRAKKVNIFKLYSYLMKLKIKKKVTLFKSINLAYFKILEELCTYTAYLFLLPNKYLLNAIFWAISWR